MAGVRISLDSIVCAFNRGETPEQILESFPLLDKLSRVYGAIAFYLDNKAMIDQYLIDAKREFEAASIPMEVANPELWARILKTRAAMVGSPA